MLKNSTYVYVSRYPFKTDENINCEQRRKEINRCLNEKIKMGKFYVWKLLENALLELFGDNTKGVDFFKIGNKWKCDLCEFSLTHSGDVVGVALSHKQVGIDIEKVRLVEEKISSKIFTPKEKDKFNTLDKIDKQNYIFSTWVNKEAIFKKSNLKIFSPSNIDSDIPIETKIFNVGDDTFFCAVCSDDKNFIWNIQR